ncbi:MAG: hypothetical protein KGH66_03480, partial [Candidatus Micrarchaeota archaeon]|nr:hypothetical protein [Candidatus Micrarchaeota archaeon]
IIKYPKGKKYKKRKGHQSLVNIKRLVTEVIEGGDDSSLYSESVFSEAYGNTRNTPSSYVSRMDYINDKYEKHRKCVYREGYKLTVNGTDGTIEEFMKDGREIPMGDPKNKTVARKLLAELDDFRNGEKFSIPKI